MYMYIVYIYIYIIDILCVCVCVSYLLMGDVAVIFQDQATAAKPLSSSSVTGAVCINVVSFLKKERGDESYPRVLSRSRIVLT